MILSKFSKRERTLLLLTMAAIFSTICYGFIVEPLINTYSRLNRRIEKGMLKLGKSYKLLRSEDAIKKEYEKYAELIKPMPSDEEEIASMLKAIEAIARANDIRITNIRPHPAKEEVFYKDFVFELIAETELDRLVKFIYDLETSGNLLRITRLTLSASSSKQKLKAIMEITKPSFQPLST